MRALRIDPTQQRHEGGCDRGRHGANAVMPRWRGAVKGDAAVLHLAGSDPCPEPRVVIGARGTCALGLSGGALGRDCPCAKLFDRARRGGRRGTGTPSWQRSGPGGEARAAADGGGLAQDATRTARAGSMRPGASSPCPGSGTLLALVIALMSLRSSHQLAFDRRDARVELGVARLDIGEPAAPPGPAVRAFRAANRAAGALRRARSPRSGGARLICTETSNCNSASRRRFASSRLALITNQ